MAEELGRGGFGAVYAGHDPQLDRRVALKLVLPRRGREDPRWEARLVREAQSLAKLRHPNVVEVFDVGVDHARGGTGGVYIVMELLRGVSVRDWLRAEPPPGWQRVVDAFVGAARGLAAAHEREIVHRDFKPDNVMITDDGRTKVIDFGLATEVGAGASTAPGSRPGDSSSGSTSGSMLTSVGSVMGTPMYMPPEQHAAADTAALTPSADQYAFCVSLYEALYGQRPFVAESMEALLLLKARGELAPPPSTVRVPRAVHRVLVRGLQSRPEARWPSMTALADALRSAASPRVPLAWMTAAIGAGTLAAVGGAMALPADDELCRPATALRASIWAPARTDPIRERLLGDGTTEAVDPWTAVDQAVVTQLDSWSSAFHTACTVQDAAAVSCLEGWLRDADVALEVLEGTDDPRSHAMSVVTDLGRLERCRGATERAGVPSGPSSERPDDPLHAEFARARALAKTGAGDEAVRRVEDALATARTQEEPGVLAYATLSAGLVFAERERLPQARRLLIEAADLSEMTGADALGVEAAVGLVRVNAALGDFEAVRLWTHVAEARMARLGRPLFMRRWMLSSRSFALVYEGDYAQAYRLSNQLVELLPAESFPFERGRALANVALNAFQLGRMHEARSVAARSIEILERTVGAHHPAVGRVLSDAGAYAAAAGDVDDGVAMMTKGVALLEAAGGPNDPYALHGKRRLANSLARLGRYDQSVEMLEQVYAGTKQLYGPVHVRSAVTAFALADQYLLGERPADAMALAREGMAAISEIYGASSARLGQGAELLARALAMQGDFDGARDVVTRALATLGIDAPGERESTINLTFVLAEIDRDQGRLDDTVRNLERAIELVKGHPSSNDPAMLASLEGARAFAEAERGQPARAVEAARVALGYLERIGVDEVEKTEFVALIERGGTLPPG